MRATKRQHRAARKLFKRNGGPVWWRVGRGKTRISYLIFAMIAKSNPTLKALVVCRRAAFFDWENEADKVGFHACFIKVETVDDLYRGHRSKLPVIYLMSHGKLESLKKELIKNVSDLLDIAVYDEGWLYKNPSTLHCKTANKITKRVGFGLLLSGSMMTARDLTDIYGQLYAINQHSILAPNLTKFRSRFLFRFAINPNGGNSAAKFIAARGARKRIARKIRDISSVYFPTNNQRRVVSDVRYVPANPSQVRAFNDLRAYYELNVNGHSQYLKNAPSVTTKCQQVSDGWVKMGRGDRPERIKSAKEEYLVGLLRDLIEAGEKVIVWCAFKMTVRGLLQALQKAFPRIGIYSMMGGQKFDSSGWHRNGRILVATESSGSSVNHFSQCAYAIYYSQTPKWHDLQQSQGRSDRHDSKHKTCYYYFLQTKGSLDSAVYAAAQASAREEREMILESEVSAWIAQDQ